eukprot:3427697-Lingulodinium_polyedra.AAC.1
MTEYYKLKFGNDGNHGLRRDVLHYMSMQYDHVAFKIDEDNVSQHVMSLQNGKAGACDWVVSEMIQALVATQQWPGPLARPAPVRDRFPQLAIGAGCLAATEWHLLHFDGACP